MTNEKQLTPWDIVGIVLLGLSGIFLFIMMLREVYAFGVDDSYIFFRYAENLAGGHGIVFNPGEPPGEGFTSWIWLLLLAFFHYIGADIIVASKVLGIFFHLLGGVTLFLLISWMTPPKERHLTDREWGAGATRFLVLMKLPGNHRAGKLTAWTLTLVFCLNYRLIAHSVSGMETSLYVFSVILLTYLTTRALLAPSWEDRWWLIISLAAAGIFFVRPEGVAVGGISLLALAIRQRQKLLKPRTWFYLFIGLVLPLALFTTWKLIVFGYPLPHSYYHKLIVITSEYQDALRQMLLFFKSYWWLMVLAFAITLYTLVKHKKYLYLYYAFLFMFMTAVYLLFYPAMNYLHRFYIPYWPLLLVMISPGIYFLITQMADFKFAVLRPLFLLILGAVLVLGINGDLKIPRYKVKGWAKSVNPNVSRAKLGVLMSRLPDDVIVANTEMGVIPYYSGLTCIDMAGLTDPYISHHKLTMTYLEKRNVDLVLFHRDTGQMSVEDWNKYTHPYGDVFLSEDFKNNFTPIGWHSGYFLYGNKESKKFAAIETWGKKYLYPKPLKARKKRG
ncbi:MAG: hypothetical protein PVH61_37625 [Candidatus Aminicenantes bacterium]|jgi:hypothetical protein